MDTIDFKLTSGKEQLSSNDLLFANALVHITDNEIAIHLKALNHLIAQKYGLNLMIILKSLIPLSTPTMLDELTSIDDVVIYLLNINKNVPIFITLNTELGRYFLSHLLNAPLFDNSLGRYFSKTEKGILAYLTARLLSDHDLGDVKILGVYHKNDEEMKALSAKGLICINMQTCMHERSFATRVMVDASLLSKPKTANTKEVLQKLGRLKDHLKIIIDTVSLTISQISTLAFGDVILLRSSSINIQKNGFIGEARAFFRNLSIGLDITQDADRYSGTILHEWCSQPEDFSMDQAELSVTTSQNASEALSEKIKVAVSVELARIPFTLKDIALLGPGSIIDLKKAPEEPLELTVEGHRIGTCIPVIIEGRLGVRVIEVFDKKNN